MTRRFSCGVAAASWIPDLNAAVDDLDRDPWLLNVENGTLDLRTGELLPHRQEDMITKIAKVRHDKGADCLLWKQFIREIMDYKGDLIGFLQGLFRVYQDWCEENNEMATSERMFGLRMKELGMVQRRRRVGGGGREGNAQRTLGRQPHQGTTLEQVKPEFLEIV